MSPFRFWMWGEYIFNPAWRQPYMKIEYSEWAKTFKGMYANKERYGTAFPRDSTTLFKQ